MSILEQDLEYKGFTINIKGEYKVGERPQREKNILYFESEKNLHFVGLLGIAIRNGEEKAEIEKYRVSSAYKDDFIKLNKETKNDIELLISDLKEKIDNKIQEDEVNTDIYSVLAGKAVDQALNGEVKSKYENVNPHRFLAPIHRY